MDLKLVKGKKEGNIIEQGKPQTVTHLMKSWPTQYGAPEQTNPIRGVPSWAELVFFFSPPSVSHLLIRLTRSFVGQ